MDRDILINILKVVALYKPDIIAFINGLDAERVEAGCITVPDQAVSRFVEGAAAQKGNGSILEPQLVFDDGYIFVSFKVKKLMTVSVSCAIEITEFKFHAGEHTMLCTYSLLGQSFKNKAIHDAIMSFGRSSDLLRRGVVIGQNSIVISFDKLAGEGKIPEWLTLRYEKCDEGKLFFRYEIQR